MKAGEISSMVFYEQEDFNAWLMDNPETEIVQLQLAPYVHINKWDQIDTDAMFMVIYRK
ncbi:MULTISPECIES: hypothetical protein [Aneurinibacillus]|uniref:hypothetical protein n=1 Tax=Aneurinibacillus TaxID=55079 RepID=UPI001379316A|nr:hypothetical protein [Aneurinibacillus migulanus]